MVARAAWPLSSSSLGPAVAASGGRGVGAGLARVGHGGRAVCQGEEVYALATWVWQATNGLDQAPTDEQRNAEHAKILQVVVVVVVVARPPSRMMTFAAVEPRPPAPSSVVRVRSCRLTTTRRASSAAFATAGKNLVTPPSLPPPHFAPPHVRRPGRVRRGLSPPQRVDIDHDGTISPAEFEACVAAASRAVRRSRLIIVVLRSRVQFRFAVFPARPSGGLSRSCGGRAAVPP